MPTILRIDGLWVTIYPNDHRPAHVHVIGAKGEAMILLNCPEEPAELRESFGFSGPEIRQIAADSHRPYPNPLRSMGDDPWTPLTPPSKRRNSVCASV